MAIDAPREWRSPLNAILRDNEPFRVRLSAEGGRPRLFAFPLDAAGKLIGEEWRCGEDRPDTPAVRLDGNCFEVNLDSLPEAAQSLSFALSLEEGLLATHQAAILQDSEALRFTPESADLKGLNALVSLLIYRKNGWRVRCVGMGFSGGAKALFEHYGAAMPAAPVQARPVPPQRPPVPAQAAPAASPSRTAAGESAQSVLLVPCALMRRLDRYLKGPAEVWVYGTDCVCLGTLRPGEPATCLPGWPRSPTCTWP